MLAPFEISTSLRAIAPRSARRVGLRLLAFAAGLFGASCAPEDGGSGNGGACVPGATAMCWCDGETPGVHECLPEMTFAPCVCDGSIGTGGDGSGGPEDDGGAVTGDDDAPPASDGTDGTTTEGGDADAGVSDDTTTAADDGDDSAGDTCTDERYAFYQACLALADNSPATDFYADCIQNCPPSTDSCGYSACIIGCTNDTPTPPEVQACRDAYPECVSAIVSEALEDCYATCSAQQQACAQGVTCTSETGSTSACAALNEGCRTSCEETGSPSDGWASASNGTCSTNESLALLYCRLGIAVSDCLATCTPGAPDCGYNDCVAGCYAEDYAADVQCEATWADCPSTNPECQSQCYADESSCITTCADVSACATARQDCLAAC